MRLDNLGGKFCNTIFKLIEFAGTAPCDGALACGADVASLASVGRNLRAVVATTSWVSLDSCSITNTTEPRIGKDRVGGETELVIVQALIPAERRTLTGQFKALNACFNVDLVQSSGTPNS